MIRIIWKFLIFLLLVIPIYSLDLITTSLNIAQAAYCSVPFAKTNTSILEYDIDKNSMRAIVGYNYDYNSTFVAYRGSENIVNWINNIRIKFTTL